MALRASSSSTAAAAAPALQNPVNVEEFTLDEAIVRRHQDIAQRWGDIGEELQRCREGNDFMGVISVVAKGLALLQDVGPMDSPVQCCTNLCMEEAQAYFNLRSGPEALAAATKAKEDLMKTATAADAAKLAEMDEFIGHALLLSGDATKAEEVFRGILAWMDTDAKKALPMVAVAAVNQRRTVLLGIGLSLKCQAEKIAETRGDSKPVFAKALDVLLDALALNSEANDAGAVKENLKGVIKCFIGVGDAPQAVSTCEKYVSYCRRGEDMESVNHGILLMQEICKAHGVQNPLVDHPAAPEPKTMPTGPTTSEIVP